MFFVPPEKFGFTQINETLTEDLLMFFLLPTLGYYPALVFFFFPPFAVIQP